MSLADDLLEQAKDLLGLAHPDSDGPDQANVISRPERRGRPKQAKLRRSISTAYYSLFSLLVDEAATAMVGSGNKKKALRGYVTRAIGHQTIRDVCKMFASRSSDNRIKTALDGYGIPDDLVTVARTCHDLQVYRHEADYNFIYSFTKEEAIDIINQTEEAHKKWETIRDNEATKVFLTALIVYKNVQKSGTTIRVPQRRSG
ncbi:MAG: hypothetical protein TQ37_05415 [Candidatus Synechococcus spongiarum 15L]|uniref:Uncharacterized protein n=2 Tax=Candidatus Synechococcus spongiarum TaxID=431041 RepID=A0A1T1C7P2_9SYNE|nr:MAG: hypothetical protein TQ37_05415 [Candidatus Synechococcus spongiarum 15L]OOV24635.1 hypothetical protein BV61_07485 [Candidatus Synechococcus spongiarum LMB bulk15M]